MQPMTSSTSNPQKPLSSVATLVDPRFVLQSLGEHGVTLTDPSAAPQLFFTAQELQKETITTDRFLEVGKGLVSAIPVIGGAIDTLDALTNLAGEIKARGQAHILQERYLAGLETAQQLEPESLKIVVAVKEVVENALDDHEVAYLQADSISIRAFPCEDIIPFLKEVEKRGPSHVPLDPIRRRREQLKEKLELQQRNVNVHLARVEGGIERITDGTYYLKTNHLPRYAAAAALEVWLRAYHVLMGKLDPEDPMVDFDCSSLLVTSENHVEKIRSLVEIYKEGRLGLVEGKLKEHHSYVHDLWHEYRYYVNDTGATNDLLCPKAKLEDIAASISKVEAEMKVRDDGSIRYVNESLSGNDRGSEPGKKLCAKIKRSIAQRLGKDGVVWQHSFQPHVQSIELVVRMVLGKEASGLFT